MAMPPVAAMQPRVLDWQDGCLRMHAPLAANINDKGCAFGGSLSSLMTIAGWGLAFLELAKAGQEADIYIADSRVRASIRTLARPLPRSAPGRSIASAPPSPAVSRRTSTSRSS